MLLAAQVQQLRPQQRRSTQIEWLRGFVRHHALQFRLLFLARQTFESDHRQIQLDGAGSLRGRTPLRIPKARAQASVARGQRIQAPFQRRDIQLALQNNSNRHVIDRESRFQLLQEPQPLLTK